MIGKRLNDRYKLLEMIGGGGMANVYLAYDGILDREVAVKILRLDYSNNEEFIKRFHREAQSVTTLSHPNIVNIYDVGEEEGIYYLVMEFVPGQTLKQYIQQHGMLSVREALDIMEQLTSAMAHAHHFEIVHRDIKPQNILIREDGVVKVTDFGIATATSATTITHTNSVLGSVHYLSPEQARGGVANKKSDIYSLGIVMFELLTGRPPFSGESAVSIALKHLQNETPSPKRWNPDIPQSVENIILKATAKDSFHRYHSVHEMREDIVTALHPQRANEQRFTVPDDVEATKAMPVIRHEAFSESGDEETIIISGKEAKPDFKNPEIVSEQEVLQKPKKARMGRGVKVLLTLFLLMVLGGIFAVTVVPSFFMPKEVEIPDVKGMTYENAVNVLSNQGFEVMSPQIIYDEEVAEGVVIKTSPEAGRIVKEHTKVTVYRSGGKKKQEMKRYIGSQYKDVKDELASYANVVTYYTKSDEPKGIIIEQVPAEGQPIIAEEQEVRIWISEGPKLIKLDDFKGWTKKSVSSFAANNNVKVEFKEEYSDSVEKDLIISQDPSSGTELKEGQSFTVVVSLGPEEKPPKKVTIKDIKISYEPADDSDATKPQTVQIYIEDMEHTMASAVTTRTITGPISLSIDLVIPYGQKARYKITRDDVVIIEQEVSYPAD